MANTTILCPWPVRYFPKLSMKVLLPAPRSPVIRSVQNRPEEGRQRLITSWGNGLVLGFGTFYQRDRLARMLMLSEYLRHNRRWSGFASVYFSGAQQYCGIHGIGLLDAFVHLLILLYSGAFSGCSYTFRHNFPRFDLFHAKIG